MEVLKDISQLTKGCGVTFEELKSKNMEAGQLLVLLIAFCTIVLHLKNRRGKE